MEDAGPTDKPLIDLLKGWPNPDYLPTAILGHCATKVLETPTAASEALQYSNEDGSPYVRQQICNWLNNFYQPRSPCSKDKLIITAGASAGLSSILSVFTDPTYTLNVWLVAPAYMLAFKTFKYVQNRHSDVQTVINLKLGMLDSQAGWGRCQKWRMV